MELCNIELHGLYSLKELKDMCDGHALHEIGVFQGWSMGITIKAHTVLNLPIQEYNKPNPKVWKVFKIVGEAEE